MINLVPGQIIDLLKQELQRVLGDTTYYVECLKKWMGSVDSNWVTNLLVNKTTEPPVPVDETIDEENPKIAPTFQR